MRLTVLRLASIALGLLVLSVVGLYAQTPAPAASAPIVAPAMLDDMVLCRRGILYEAYNRIDQPAKFREGTVTIAEEVKLCMFSKAQAPAPDVPASTAVPIGPPTPAIPGPGAPPAVPLNPPASTPDNSQK